jgi:Domain of unknown function (DUF4112)
VLTRSQRESSSELAWVEDVTRLLDTKFRIPGTRIRFGADFILGLVPGLGDVLSMGFSALLIVTMVRKGASVNLALRMLFNVLLDTVVGSIPLLGNVFDLFYKANYRNLLLMREHYDEGKHAGSAWPIVLCIIAVLAVLVAAILGVFFWVLSNPAMLFPASV